jgi:hypothetical protein
MLRGSGDESRVAQLRPEVGSGEDGLRGVAGELRAVVRTGGDESDGGAASRSVEAARPPARFSVATERP